MKPGTVVVNTSESPNALLRPVPVGSVKLRDSFWEPRRQLNRKVTLRSQYEQCEKTGRIENFLRAAGKVEVKYHGPVYNDSDVYKWIEAIGWTLATDKDEELERLADRVIDIIADAQQSDGYLNTAFMFEDAAKRWSNIRDWHELYCAGHLIQAAIAYNRATGKNKLLDVARKFADLICSLFGPESEGKRTVVPGHEEIEMALAELARETGNEKYLKQANFFIDARGNNSLTGSWSGPDYYQDAVPLREQSRVVGHAVRAMYLNCGAADMCAENKDKKLTKALHRMWENMTYCQMYVTGGIGPRHEGEAFGKDYELPRESAYADTSATIGKIM